MSRQNAQNASRLQSGSRVEGFLLAGGIVSVLVLAGLFVTSLNRAPNATWTVVTGALEVVLAVLIAPRLVKWSRRHR